MSGASGVGSARILAVIALVALIDGIDGSIVNVALPSLADWFGTDAGTIAWVTVSYFLMMAGLLMLFARIAKNGAIRKVMVGGVAVFTAASLACALSPSLEALLAARTVQGVGAAMMGAAAPMACVRYLPEGKIGLGMGVITLGCSTGFAVGPAVGGLMVDALSWHWIFFINLPLGAAITMMILGIVPRDGRYDRRRLDAPGAALLFAATAAGTYALERLPYPSEGPLVAAAAVACLACLAAFVRVELGREEPLLNVRVFRHARFDAAFLAFMIVNMVYIGMLYLMPFYLEMRMGMDPSVSGMFLFIPPAVTLALCIPISKRSDRTGRRRYSVLSCLFLLAGAAAMALWAGDGSMWPLLAALACMGLTWAFAGGPMASRIVESTADESREIGSSLMNESVYLGITAGTALFAMLFTLGSGSGGAEIGGLSRDAFMDGFVFSMAFCAILAALAALISHAMRDGPPASG
ncbi:MAG: MFS transporter [Candidatus Methanoplasma sp.]|jgi:EmrB/QacA subfamily drug resistance transporter|nr:MFS transporter [Candidatus Methanoplasma sp.]